MDGELPDFIQTLDATDRLVLLLHWADRCTVPEMQDILGLDRRRIVASLDRIRGLAADGLALNSTTIQAATPDRLHPRRRHR